LQNQLYSTQPPKQFKTYRFLLDKCKNRQENKAMETSTLTSETIIYTIIDILEYLPLDRQLQLLDFSEFILHRHIQDIKNGTFKNTEKDVPATDELKSFLKQRLKAHRENPEGATDWDILEKKLLERHVNEC
jgi:hypothetical protein